MTSGQLLAMLGAQILVSPAWFAFSALLPGIQREWGLSATQAGLILGGFQAGYLVASLLAGSFSDRMRPRLLLVGGTLVCALGGIGFALFAHGFWTGLAWRVVTALGLGCIYIPGSKLFSLVFPREDRGRVIGLWVGSLVIGLASIFLLGGPIAVRIGWRGTTAGAALLALGAAGLFLWAVPSVRPPAGPRRGRERLTDPVLWLFIGAYVGHNWELFICWGWLAPFLVAAARVQGWEAGPATDIGTILTGFTILASGFVSIWAARLSDRVGRVPVIVAALGASTACSLSLGWLLREPLPLVAAVAFVYGVGALGESAVYTTGITETAPPHLVGTALGLQALTGFAASVISPALFGKILDLTNGAGEIRRIGYALHWGPAFMSAGLGSIAALVAALSLRRRLALRDWAHGPVSPGRNAG